MRKPSASLRKEREKQVLDAAVALARAPKNDNMLEFLRLLEKTEVYIDLGLDTDFTPAIANDATDSSADAGQSIKPRIGKVARRVFDEIAYTGQVGATADQIDATLHLGHQTTSARVTELRDKGWIVWNEQHRKTRKGSKARVYVASAAALALEGR